MVAVSLAGCDTLAPPADPEAIEAAAHDAYVDAINSNDVDAIMAVMTDDVVLQAPGAPELVGKDAVRAWVEGYLAAFESRWDKTSIGFTVSGDWAFERYAYTFTDTNRESGEVTTGSGKGINIFHREDDGIWRVAVDGWSDIAPAAGGNGPQAVAQALYDAFAAGDMDAAAATMSPDIVWLEAEGNPYADRNPYVGPDAVLSGVFMRIGGEWDGFTATPERFVADGDRVVVFGRYTGTYQATGRALDVPFVHAFTVQDGRITAFQQYTDTAEQVAVMGQ